MFAIGSYKDLFFSTAHYANKHLAVEIMSQTEGPYARLTVNLPETKQYPVNYAFLDTNNFPDGEDLVEELGVARFTGRYGFSGMCAYPLYEFFPDKLKTA